MKIAIVGSRNFTNYEFAKRFLLEFIQQEDVIISGGAKGADTIAEQFADELGNEKIIYKPDWDKYGKSAGMIRNGKIVEDCDYVIAFWDNKSRGTADTIRKAQNLNKQVIKIDVAEIIKEDLKNFIPTNHQGL